MPRTTAYRKSRHHTRASLLTRFKGTVSWGIFLKIYKNLHFLRYKNIGAPKNLKNWPRPLFRPRTDHACPQKPNPSRETIPLRGTIQTFNFMSWSSSWSAFFLKFSRFFKRSSLFSRVSGTATEKKKEGQDPVPTFWSTFSWTQNIGRNLGTAIRLTLVRPRCVPGWNTVMILSFFYFFNVIKNKYNKLWRVDVVEVPQWCDLKLCIGNRCLKIIILKKTLPSEDEEKIVYNDNN